MKIRVENLEGVILDILRQLKSARCTATKEGIADFEVKDEISLTFDVIARNGLNALPRLETSSVDGGTTTTSTGERIEIDESGVVSTESKVAPVTATTNQTRTEAPSTQKQVVPERVSVTLRESDQNTSTVKTEETNEGITNTGESGVNIRETQNTYE